MTAIREEDHARPAPWRWAIPLMSAALIASCGGGGLAPAWGRPTAFGFEAIGLVPRPAETASGTPEGGVAIEVLGPGSPPLSPRDFPKAGRLYPILVHPSGDGDAALDGTYLTYAYGKDGGVGPGARGIDGKLARTYSSDAPVLAPGEFSVTWISSRSGRIERSGRYRAAEPSPLRFIGASLHPSGRPVGRLLGLAYAEGRIYAAFEAPWSYTIKAYTPAEDGSLAFLGEEDSIVQAIHPAPSGLWAYVATGYQEYAVERIQPRGDGDRIADPERYPGELPWAYQGWRIVSNLAPSLAPGSRLSLILGESLVAAQDRFIAAFSMNRGARRFEERGILDLGRPVTAISRSGDLVLAAFGDGSLASIDPSGNDGPREIGGASPQAAGAPSRGRGDGVQGFLASSEDRAWVLVQTPGAPASLHAYAIDKDGAPSLLGERRLPAIASDGARSVGEGLALSTRPLCAPARDELWLPDGSGNLTLSPFACPEGYEIGLVRGGKAYLRPRGTGEGTRAAGLEALRILEIATGRELAEESAALGALIASSFPGSTLTSWADFDGGEGLAVLKTDSGGVVLAAVDLDGSAIRGKAQCGSPPDGELRFAYAAGIACAYGGWGIWNLRSGTNFRVDTGEREGTTVYGAFEPIGKSPRGVVVRARRISDAGGRTGDAVLLASPEGLEETGLESGGDYCDIDTARCDAFGEGYAGLISRGDLKLFHWTPGRGLQGLRVSPLQEIWAGVAGGALRLMPGPSPWLFLSYAAEP